MMLAQDHTEQKPDDNVIFHWNLRSQQSVSKLSKNEVRLWNNPVHVADTFQIARRDFVANAGHKCLSKMK
jgi:hypothetical protein